MGGDVDTELGLGHRPSASQNSTRQMARIDHGSQPSQTKATRTIRSHVTRERKPCTASSLRNIGVGNLDGMPGS